MADDDTLARLTGIQADDPDRQSIIPVLFAAHRRGEDLRDPEVVARCVIEGRYLAQRHRERASREVVYYVRIGPFVKIGTTINLAQRLNSYPPDAELLATEAGGRDVESQRHRQFKHLLSGRREWFTPASDLLAHCDTLGRHDLTERAPR